MIRKKAFYLELRLRGEIVEGRPEMTFFSRKEKYDIRWILDALERAAGDRRIVAAILKVERPELGWGRLQDIRRALEKFRRSGRPAWLYMESGGNKEYYLATGADRILMPPTGNLDIVGLNAEVTYFRSLLDRLGIEPDLAQIGRYKTAGEIFTRSSMSDEQREVLNSLLDDLFEQVLDACEQGRKLSRDQWRQIIDGAPYTARQAVELGCIDRVAYEDEVEPLLQAELGGKLKRLPFEKYSPRDGFLRRLLLRRPKVALVHVVGPIASGETRRTRGRRIITGSETISQFLGHARKSRAIRSVVIRVDSPGGSALASDIIWREIQLTRQKKPVVVSMGDVAASGGYYVSLGAQRIFAEPGTLTGSIGVIGGKVNLEGLLQKFGIQRESVRRGTHAQFFSFSRSFTDEERTRLQQMMEEFYRHDFLKKVMESRGLSESEAEQVAGGRVFTGRQSLAHGLVDSLGGLNQALDEAKRLAGIPERRRVRVVQYVRRRRLRDLLGLDWAPATSRLFEREPFLALMPFHLDIF
ncbi:MAG: signal peptide peptidase SppA [Acidobacteria bacterium]|nr:signal peptide peptidase SppA [Acidobacteriota bacterium]